MPHFVFSVCVRICERLTDNSLSEALENLIPPIVMPVVRPIIGGGAKAKRSVRVKRSKSPRKW